jgi:hypothetical protein
MQLNERLLEMVRACFTGLWIQSHEHEDAWAEILTLCRSQGWRVARWDIDQGLWLAGRSAVGSSPSSEMAAADPLAAVRALSALPASQDPTLLVLVNFHRYLQSAEIVQALSQQIVAGKQHRTFMVILSPLVTIPVELEKLFVVLNHELPSRRQLLDIARGVATEAGELPDAIELERVLDAAAGLTRYEAEGAYSLSLVRHERLEPHTLWEIKAQTLLKSGLMKLHRGGDKFDQLGGLDALKAFCLRALLPRPATALTCRPRGVMLLGVPGTGKSAFCKALGNETGRPTVTLDIGNLLGSLVGQSEERTRQALQILDAMAPCIAFIDEVEKAFGGVGGHGDSGVSTRMFGAFLAWLNDHESDVFVVCTANDVARLPPEFSRSERFDGVFFLDLPGPSQRALIWQQYLQHFQLDPLQPRPDDAQWTGAEIKSCCRLAALLDLPLLAAAQNVVPVSVTAAESVERLRGWASGRCLHADSPGLYQRQPLRAQVRRRISRSDPASN